MEQNQSKDYLSPEEFASVWSRVAPEGSGGIRLRPAVEEETAPPLSCPVGAEKEICPFLERQMRMERHFGQALRGLNQCELARQAGNRERRLTAALFLHAGGWCRPQTPEHRRERGRREAIRELFHMSRQMEGEYRTASEAAGEDLALLFMELAEEHQRAQHRLRRLLEGCK